MKPGKPHRIGFPGNNATEHPHPLKYGPNAADLPFWGPGWISKDVTCLNCGRIIPAGELYYMGPATQRAFGCDSCILPPSEE